MPDHASWTDADLLDAYQQHESEQAFAELVRRHMDLVYGIAMRKTKRADWANDIAQEVFTLLARKARSSFKMRSTLSNWLYQTTLYQTAHRFRTEQRYWNRNARYYQDEQIRLEQDAEGIDTGQLDDALNTLNHDERMVVLSHYYEGKTYREIGDDLGKSSEACRKMCSRAIDRLGEWLKAHGQVATQTSLGVALAAVTTHEAPAQLAPRITERALSAASSSALTGMWALWVLPSLAVLLGAMLPLLIVRPHLAARKSPPQTQSTVAIAPSILPAQRTDTRAHRQEVNLLELARRLGSYHASDYPMMLAPRVLARSLDDAQLARLAKITIDEKLWSSSEFVFLLWGERDPLAALKHLDYSRITRKHSLQAINMGQVNFKGFVQPLRHLFRGWALSNPQHLVTWAEQQGRTEDLFFASDALASYNPEYALALAPDPEATEEPYLKRLRGSAFNRWSRIDPDAVRQHLRQQGFAEDTLDKEVERLRGPNTMTTSGAADVLRSIAFAQQLQDADLRAMYLEQSFQWLGLLHPPLAIREFEALPEDLSEDSWLAQILRHYAEVEPAEAEAWTSEHLEVSLDEFLKQHNVRR